MLANNISEARLISENDVNEILKSIHAEGMLFIASRKKKSNPEGLLSVNEMSYILRKQLRMHLTASIHKII